MEEDGLLTYKNIIYIPSVANLMRVVMDDIHQASYSGHQGYQKTIATARKQYFWPGMKNDIVEYMSRCMKCQHVKVEPQHPVGLLQHFPVSEWKWEVISMDFITGLPMTWRQHDSIILDKLTKATKFIPVKSTDKTDDIAKIFMKEIFKLHGLPKAIVSNRDVKFTSILWKGLFVDLSTRLNFSTSYHPQTDGQMERVNQVLEDMLCMYVMDKPSKWEDYLDLVYFSYNNGQQASLGMSPYEALYDRRCSTLVSWDNPMNRVMLGPELLKEMKQEVVKIKQNLKAA